MPANLTPQYYEKEREYREAKTHQEKLHLLKEMLSIMPKHKGTDKLQADLKKKISKLSKLMEKQPSKSEVHPFSHIEKEGAGQVILIGKPNVGKSHLISSLTNVDSPPTPYPYSTRKPIVGMMEFEDIKIQLIDTPSIAKGIMEKWLPQLVRESDLVLLVVDLGEEAIIEEIEEVREMLGSQRISLGNNIEKEFHHKNSLLIANKNDLAGAKERFSVLKKLYKEQFSILEVSALEGNWGNFKEKVFNMLNVERIYTKEPGKPFTKEEPFIMKKGSSVYDFATSIHKDFLNLKYARLWDNHQYSGQRVERTHILKDKDIVEIHL